MKGVPKTYSKACCAFFILVFSLILTGPTRAASYTSNSWTSASGGNWQDNTWSLNVPPGPGQYVYLTNSGTKEIVINTSTAQSLPGTLQVQSLELSSAPDGTNQLLMDYVGLQNPLVVGPLPLTVNAVTVTAPFTMNASALVVEGCMSLFADGIFNESSGSQVNVTNLYLEGGSVYAVNNSTLSAQNEYIGHFNSAAQMIQQGGTNLVTGNLDVILASEFDLYSGLVTGAFLTVEGNFYLWGGSVQMQKTAVNGTTFEHFGGDCSFSMLTLSNAAWDEWANGGQFGRLQLQATNWLIMPPTNACVMTFLNSSNLNWPAGAMLFIQGWNGSRDGGGLHQILFGTNGAGLNGWQLEDIEFVNPPGLPAGYYVPTLLATGELVPSTHLVPPPITTNIWLGATSGYWEDAINWSSGLMPTTNQEIYLTNAGWKALAIGPGTVEAHPGSLNIRTLTVSAPANSLNTLLMNYSGLNTPLIIGNPYTINGTGSLLVDANGVFDMLASSLVVYDDTNRTGNTGMFSIRGTFNESEGSQLSAGFMNIGDQGPGVFNLTNGLLSVKQYEAINAGYNSPSAFNQYGGTNATSTLALHNYSAYNLYDGLLSVTNVESIGDPNGLACALTQRGGTNAAGSISINTRGKYDYYGGVIQGTIVLNGATFNQWSGNISSTPISLGEFSFYNLAGGNFYNTNGTLTFNGGCMWQTGGTNYAGNMTVLSSLDPTIVYVNTEPGYILSNGVLQATSLTVQPFTDTNHGGLRKGWFAQSGGFQTNGYVTVTNSYYTMTGGIQQTSGMELTDAMLHQYDGTNFITGTLTVNRGTLAWLDGGVFSAQNLVLNYYSTVFHYQADCSVGSLTFSGGSWVEQGTNLQLGQVQLSGYYSFGRVYLPTYVGEPCVMRFADSGSVQWSTNYHYLGFYNWNGSFTGGGLSQIYFGTNDSGLTSNQLSHVYISDLRSNIWTARILPTGEIVPNTGKTLLHSSFTREGKMQLLVVGEAQHTYQVQVSSNLVNWVPWTNVFAPSGTFLITDTNVTKYFSRFYRTVVTQ